MNNSSSVNLDNTANPAMTSPVSGGLRRRVTRPRLAGKNLTFLQVVGFILLHVPLMLVFRVAPVIATLHSLVTFLLGLGFLLLDRHPRRVVWVIAYIAGAEILWRGVEATLVWEYGKYITLLLCALMILKYHLVGRTTLWSSLFILLLVPGVFVAPGFDREAVSYQLAGPITLAAASMAFGAMGFRKTDLQRLFLSLIGPIVSMAFLVLYLALTQNIVYSGGGENEAITGGIGANQVSSALSLGATAAFYYVFLLGNNRRLRYLMVFVGLGLLITSVLTFSRAGLWNTVGAVAASAFYLLGDRRRSLRLLSILVVVGLVVYFAVLPLLSSLTGDAVFARFRDFDSTGRDILIWIDYQLFLENPIWGVGVGQSPYYHAFTFGYPKPTHTEYSRLLAEHGSFGIAVFVLFVVATLIRFFSRRSAISKGFALGFTVWALLYMAHSATRMVAPSFAFGLAAAHFLPEEDETS